MNRAREVAGDALGFLGYLAFVGAGFVIGIRDVLQGPSRNKVPGW